MTTYKINRFHQDGDTETLITGLTLEEAQAHCNDPETSSRTATSEMAKQYTAKHGAWFDGYTDEA